MKSVHTLKKLTLTPGRVILAMLLFILAVSLACSTASSDGQFDATQSALNLQSTELAIKGTQLAQEASQQQDQEPTQQQDPGIAPPANESDDQQATQAAQQATLDSLNATQIAIAVQQTSIASGSTGDTGGNPPPPQPTQGVTTEAGLGFSNFTDNFMDTSSGWPTQRTEMVQYFYATDQHYYIVVDSSDTQAVVPYDYFLTNGVVMASGKVTVDQPLAYYGVVCRYQDINNYYFFEVGYDGFYQIGKFWNGQWSLIGMGDTKYSSTINMSGYNLVAGHCYENELSLYVNDIFVETVYDNTFTSGYIGLSASTYGFPGLNVAFDFIIAEE